MAVKNSKSKAPYRAKVVAEPTPTAPEGWATQQWRAALEAGPRATATFPAGGPGWGQEAFQRARAQGIPINRPWSPTARPRWEDLSPEQQNSIMERYSKEMYGQAYMPAPRGWTEEDARREQERAYRWALEQSELGEPTSYAYQFGPEYPEEYPGAPFSPQMGMGGRRTLREISPMPAQLESASPYVSKAEWALPYASTVERYFPEIYPGWQAMQPIIEALPDSPEGKGKKKKPPMEAMLPFFMLWMMMLSSRR